MISRNELTKKEVIRLLKRFEKFSEEESIDDLNGQCKKLISDIENYEGNEWVGVFKQDIGIIESKCHYVVLYDMYQRYLEQEGVSYSKLVNYKECINKYIEKGTMSNFTSPEIDVDLEKRVLGLASLVRKIKKVFNQMNNTIGG